MHFLLFTKMGKKEYLLVLFCFWSKILLKKKNQMLIVEDQFKAPFLCLYMLLERSANQFIKILSQLCLKYINS